MKTVNSRAISMLNCQHSKAVSQFYRMDQIIMSAIHLKDR